MSYVDSTKVSVLVTQGQTAGEGTLKHLHQTLTDLGVYDFSTKPLKGDEDVKLEFNAPADSIFVKYLNVLYGKLGTGASKDELEQFVDYIDQVAGSFEYE